MMNIIGVQGLPFLACLVMLSILGYIGVHVLKREIIFIDIALAQIAAVGAVVAHVVFHFHDHTFYTQALALGSTLIAAAFFAIVRRRIEQIPLEAVIGVTYAVSAASALFLVGVAPGGHVHIQEMLAGSILWATWDDIWWSAGVFAAVGACFFLFRNPFTAISDSYEGAVAKGYRTLGWDFLFYALVGMVITMAVRIAGVVVVFTFLIIPATLSALFFSGWTSRVLVAWAVGAVSAAVGLLFADCYDFSVGPAIALFLGAALVVISVLRFARVPRIPTASVWIVISLILGIWFASGTQGRSSPPAGGLGRAASAGSITHVHPHNDEPVHDHADDMEAGSNEIDRERLSAVTDSEELQAMFTNAADAEEQNIVICRALEINTRLGVSMAIEYLQGDPPLLFRLTIVEKVGEVTGRPFPYDIGQPFTAAANQEAVKDLKIFSGLE